MTALRIGMWSGPRNISTAMMRAWENRPDCTVSDEPLYAAYLAETGLDHPGRDEVIAAGDTDWRRVTQALLGPVPGGKPVWYQKHMAHHLLPGMDHEWIHGLRNVLLIRDPDDVVSSYLRSRATVAPADIGLLQQAALFDELSLANGEAPVVVDSGEFLAEPERFLRALCAFFGLPFTERMLHWPPGPRDSDGVWAPHWYGTVWQSTGFEPPSARPAPVLDAEARAVADACRPAYEKLRAARLRP